MIPEAQCISIVIYFHRLDRGLDVARWLKISPTEVLTNDLSEV